jgi:hypothetical protein
MNYNFTKYLALSFGIIIATAFFLNTSSTALAYEKIMTGNAGHTNYYPGGTIAPAGKWVYNYQQFATSSPTASNISSFQFYVERENSASSSNNLLKWNICEGKIIKSNYFIMESGHWAENNDIGNDNFGCNYAGIAGEPLLSGEIALKNLATSSSGLRINIDDLAIETNIYYYLEWRYYEPYNYPSSWVKEWYDTTANWPSDQENFICNYPCGNSLVLYYETNYSNYFIRWDTRPLPESWPSISLPDSIICDLDAPCLYPFRYNSMAVGRTVFLKDFNNGMWNTANILDTHIITATTSGINYLNAPATSTEQKIYYWAELQNREIFQLQVEYLATTTQFFTVIDKCLPDQVCQDVATSSGSFADDFRFGLECGFQKFVCWAFVPSPQAQKFLYNNVNQLKSSFPFNTYFSLINTVNTALATTTDKNSTLGLPFIETPEQGANFYIMPLLSSSSMPNAIGQENTDLFRLTIGYVIWILISVLIIFTISI